MVLRGPSVGPDTTTPAPSVRNSPRRTGTVRTVQRENEVSLLAQRGHGEGSPRATVRRPLDREDDATRFMTPVTVSMVEDPTKGCAVYFRFDEEFAASQSVD